MLGYETFRIVLAMSAKLFISSAFAILYLLGAELYPTEMRTTGLAVGVFMGRCGAMTAPYIADMMVSTRISRLANLIHSTLDVLSHTDLFI